MPFFKFKETPPVAGLAEWVSTTQRWLCRGESAIDMREKHAKNHFTQGKGKRRGKGVRGIEVELRKVSKEMLQDNTTYLEIQVFPRWNGTR